MNLYQITTCAVFALFVFGLVICWIVAFAGDAYYFVKAQLTRTDVELPIKTQ